MAILMPGCGGNNVPPGFKANLQPLTPLWDYWLLGALPTKINRVLIGEPSQGHQLM